MSPLLSPSLDLCVLQLLELQAFLSRAPKSLTPREMAPVPLIHPPQEHWPEPEPGSVGYYLFLSSPHPAHHICTDENEHWKHGETGMLACFFFNRGWSGRQSPEVAHIPNPALPSQREPLDLGWCQAQGSPPPSSFCLLTCPRMVTGNHTLPSVGG